MKRNLALFMFFAAAAPMLAEEPSLTVYNQNFAVVREKVPLDLKEGVNEVSYADVTAHVEPQSVMLRDPADEGSLKVMEQNYRNDPVSQELLLALFEGKEIEFLKQPDRNSDATTGPTIVRGKIVRSGYIPHTQAFSRYGQEYQVSQQAMAQGTAPIIEVDGQLRFGLPGTPLFPSLGDDTILKPTLSWQLMSAKAGAVSSELSYVTGGMSWNADYNLVLPPKGDQIDLIGWVTIDNQSGKAFTDAAIQLIAGDVQKIQKPESAGYGYGRVAAMAAPEMDMKVKEQVFDEYHLYTLPRKTTLRDHQTKQIEFMRAEDAASTMSYVYDGSNIDWRQYAQSGPLLEQNFGIEMNKKVSVIREFMNSEENKLGLPLPKGKVRMYRRDEQGRLQFTGENEIDHTPRDEKVRMKSGEAFDLVGERLQTNFVADSSRRMIDESFEITLRNHKEEPVEIQVIEHLYRYMTWEITESTVPHEKLDTRTARFKVQVPAHGEQKMTYNVRYTW